jgi:hypothetical protein
MNKKGCLIIIVLLFCSNLLFAQWPPAWGGGADQQDLSFGFTFSYVNSYFKIVKKPDWRNPFLDATNGNQPVTSYLNSIGSANSPGFAVGFITRYSLTEHLEVRVTPSLVFGDRTLSYVYEDASQNVTKDVQTTTVDLPLSLKLKSDRVGNFRAYLLGGVKYSYGLGSKIGSDATAALLEKTVKNVNGYASYEAGIGCDLYFEYFKLSPEIKLSNSIGNVLVPENQPFSGPISKLFLHTVMISLYFE